MRLITVPGVFKPRSDSLLLAELAAARVRAGSSALDPFTGSGILAIAAAAAGARAAARRGDMFEPVAGQRFDLIVANPPYVPGPVDGPVRGAARAWEGGDDGRILIDRLCDEVAAHLQPGGELLMVHSHVCGEK